MACKFAWHYNRLESHARAEFPFNQQPVNGRKGTKIVLDPACFPADREVYHLDFVTGAIFPNPVLIDDLPTLYRMAEQTVKDLELDDGLYRDERMEVWNTYLSSSRGAPEREQLKKTNNFVWQEAVRQGLI